MLSRIQTDTAGRLWGEDGEHKLMGGGGRSVSHGRIQKAFAEQIERKFTGVHPGRGGFKRRLRRGGGGGIQMAAVGMLFALTVCVIIETKMLRGETQSSQ